MLDQFNRFYKFGTLVKQKAALYTMAILFTHSLYNFLSGVDTIKIIHILEAFIISFIVALVEYSLFSHYEDLDIPIRKRNTIIGFVLGNVIFIGSAIMFNWYVAIPPWGIALLLVLLEGGLIALRYSIYVINELDSRNLNKKKTPESYLKSSSQGLFYIAESGLEPETFGL